MITDEVVDIVYLMLDGKTYSKQAVRIALEAALSAVMPAQASVKPLEWDQDAVKGFACSRNGALSYSIMLSVNRVYGIKGEHDGAAQFDTLEAAKAAAQADYSARILSALSISPAPVDGEPTPSTHAKSSKAEPRFAVGDMVERISGGTWMGMAVGDKGVVAAVIPTANNWHDLRIAGFDGVYSDFRFRLADNPSPQTHVKGEAE